MCIQLNRTPACTQRSVRLSAESFNFFSFVAADDLVRIRARCITAYSHGRQRTRYFARSWKQHCHRSVENAARTSESPARLRMNSRSARYRNDIDSRDALLSASRSDEISFAVSRDHGKSLFPEREREREREKERRVVESRSKKEK